MTLDERTADGDYTALPAWYLLDLLRPRLQQIQAQHRCTLAQAATRLTSGDLASASHLNYVVNAKIGLVGLRICERLLDLAGLSHRDADDDMWVPTHGIRPAIRMAGDELYARDLGLTEDALVARARVLIARRQRLLEGPP
jgi:hypothetical protein